MRKLKFLIGFCALALFLNFTVDDRTETGELKPIALTTWADGAYELLLPETVDDYSYEKPDHYAALSGLGNGLNNANVGIDNNIATLGRVLFYDKNLSKNETVSCGSCHKQEFGFADNKPTSPGFNDQLNTRNAISFADLDYTPYRDLFWDDRETELTHMLTLPLVNDDEMGWNNMDEAIDAVKDQPYYPALFELAFNGNDQITKNKVGEALSHFVRSIAAVNTRLDNEVKSISEGIEGFHNDIPSFTESENLGRAVFQKTCQNCHSSIMTAKTYEPIQSTGIFNAPHNTGLDAITIDPGVGFISNIASQDAMFKTPTLKNVAFSAPYMHDGRFETLEKVIEFYSEGLENHPNSAFNPNSITNSAYYSNNPPLPDNLEGFDFTDLEKQGLLDFLHTLSDYTTIEDPKFSDPFIEQGTVGIQSLASLNVSTYPNPSFDVVNIQLNEKFDENVQISIYDLSGQLVRTENALGRLIQIERGTLPVGNYLVKVSDAQTIASTKIIFK